MRKFVVFIALLSFSMGLMQCDNAPSSSKTEQTPRKGLFKNKKAKAEEKADGISQADSVVVDSSLAEEPNPVPAPTDVVELPEPEEPENLDWESAADADTLGSDSNEITEEWLDEEDIDYDEGEFEDEYVDYPDGDVQLRMERILKSEVVNVLVPEVRDEMDSTLAIIEERMSLSAEGPSKQVVVEKWYSPVNYRGYKFNRKKLMLYGVDKAMRVDVYFYLGEYYFAFNTRLYNLEETSKNLAFDNVKDTMLVNYILKYDY